MDYSVTAFLLIVLSVPSFLFAKNLQVIHIPANLYENQLNEEIGSFYKTEWDKASDIFEKLMRRDSHDSRAFFFNSMIPFWEYFYGGNFSDTVDKFLKRSGRTIKVSYLRFKEYQPDTMMGLKGNKEEGYKLLQEAVRSTSHVSNEARMILVCLYKREAKFHKSPVSIQKLYNRYPANIIFQFNYTELLAKCGR